MALAIDGVHRNKLDKARAGRLECKSETGPGAAASSDKDLQGKARRHNPACELVGCSERPGGAHADEPSALGPPVNRPTQR